MLAPFGAAEIAGDGAGDGRGPGRRADPEGEGAGRPAGAAGGRRRRLRRRAVARLARGGLPRGHGRRDGMRFPGLVENEILKFARQRRFRVVVLILVALIGLIVFAQSRGRERFLAGKDWHVATQERMARIQNWLRDGRMPATIAAVGALRARPPAVPPRARHQPGGHLGPALRRAASPTRRATCCCRCSRSCSPPTSSRRSSRRARSSSC